jgi:hypothetical protein
MAVFTRNNINLRNKAGLSSLLEPGQLTLKRDFYDPDTGAIINTIQNVITYDPSGGDGGSFPKKAFSISGLDRNGQSTFALFHGLDQGTTVASPVDVSIYDREDGSQVFCNISRYVDYIILDFDYNITDSDHLIVTVEQQILTPRQRLSAFHLFYGLNMVGGHLKTGASAVDLTAFLQNDDLCFTEYLPTDPSGSAVTRLQFVLVTQAFIDDMYIGGQTAATTAGVVVGDIWLLAILDTTTDDVTTSAYVDSKCIKYVTAGALDAQSTLNIPALDLLDPASVEETVIIEDANAPAITDAWFEITAPTKINKRTFKPNGKKGNGFKRFRR